MLSVKCETEARMSMTVTVKYVGVPGAVTSGATSSIPACYLDPEPVARPMA